MRYPAIVTSNGRVTIPPAMRNRYGFTPGTAVTWLDENEELFMILPGPERSLYFRVTFDNSAANSTPKKKIKVKHAAKR
jgi:bifunctional DNA-binding transcriptional regulator/antitoxin component of YhaV-PrlF toxin-antitoxin module